MKKFFLLTAVVISCSVLCHAQFKVGVKAGVNLSDQFRKDPAGYVPYSTDRYTGFHSGLVGDMKISENIYLQPQLLYSRKGATHVSASDGTRTKVRMNYVEVPLNILYKFQVPFGKLFVGAAPVFSYAFSGKLEQNGQTKKMYSDDLKNWKRGDIGLSYTGGVEFNNGLFASVQFQSGKTDIYKTEGQTVKNRVLSASVGYLIDWKKSKHTAKQG